MIYIVTSFNALSNPVRQVLPSAPFREEAEARRS